TASDLQLCPLATKRVHVYVPSDSSLGTVTSTPLACAPRSRCARLLASGRRVGSEAQRSGREPRGIHSRDPRAGGGARDGEIPMPRGSLCGPSLLGGSQGLEAQRVSVPMISH